MMPAFTRSLNSPVCASKPQLYSSLVEHLAGDHRAILAGVLGDLAQRRLHRLAHDLDAEALVVVVRLQLRQDQRRARQRHAAARHNAFLDRGTRGVQPIIDAVLALLHLDLGRAADADHRNATGQLRQPLLQLLAVVVRGGLLDLGADLIAAQVEETTSDYDREKLQERLAKLAGGVAVIRVGGSTEVEVKERKDRVDDALHATRAAVEEGIVPGGGVPLARASLILSKLKADNDDQRFGIEIVRKAVQTPLRQIAENAGEDGAVIAGKVLDRDEYNWGFDAQTGEFKDLVKAGIIDPTKVVRTALQDAASVAGLLVTTEAMVAEKPEKKAPAMPPGGGMGGWATWTSDREVHRGDGKGRAARSALFFVHHYQPRRICRNRSHIKLTRWKLRIR